MIRGRIMKRVILVRVRESVGSGQFHFIMEEGDCSSNQMEEEVYPIISNASY
jgi:hypothetical protein